MNKVITACRDLIFCDISSYKVERKLVTSYQIHHLESYKSVQVFQLYYLFRLSIHNIWLIKRTQGRDRAMVNAKRPFYSDFPLSFESNLKDVKSRSTTNWSETFWPNDLNSKIHEWHKRKYFKTKGTEYLEMSILEQMVLDWNFVDHRVHTNLHTIRASKHIRVCLVVYSTKRTGLL